MTRAPLATLPHPTPHPLSAMPESHRHVGVSRRPLPLLLAAPLLLVLQGCCGDDPRDALPLPPDQTCRLGVEVGDDVAVWDCVDNEHVVAYRGSTTLFGCSGTSMERVPCGQLTPFEIKHGADAQRSVCEGEPPLP
jgi:hypothetical protein